MSTMQSFGRGWSVLLAAVWLSVWPAFAQRGRSQTPEFSSMLSTGVVKLGSVVNWVVSVEGSEDCKILEVPTVDGLEIQGPGAPHLEQSITMDSRGTRRQLRLSWVLRVRPLAAGDYTIPPLKLSIDGREQFTKELPLEVVLDMKGEELGYFEKVDVPARVYEGEPFTLDLRMGWNAELDIGAARLILPWWQELRGVLEIEQVDRDMVGRDLAFGLNARGQIRVEELSATTREGKTYRSFRLGRRFLASRTGKLEIPESFLEFAQLVSDSQRRGFFAQQELEEFYVHLPAFVIEVLPIPEDGRPFEWSGAVGNFDVARKVDKQDVDVGDSIKLSLMYSGTGNLEFFEAPDLSRLDSFVGFHLVGTESEFLGDERRITYDLVSTSEEVSEIPSVPLWIFDTTKEAYRKVESAPVSIRVRAKPGATGLEAEGGSEEESDIRDIAMLPILSKDRPRPGGRSVGMLALALPVSWWFTRRWVRRSADPDAPAERARRRAKKNLRQALRRARGASEQSAALAAFLGARTGEGAHAWLGRSAKQWAEENGLALPMDLLQRLDQMFDELAARAWRQEADANAPLDPNALHELAEALVKGGL